MALISLSEIDGRGKARYAHRLMQKSAASILSEDSQKYSLDHQFDIFLSHSYVDAKLNFDRLLGIKGFLEEFEYSVYVDWIIDKQLNREKVTADTASTLRSRMDHSRCLLFATSESSQNSRWMPWELGYKDGNSGKDGGLGMVAVLPLVTSKTQTVFQGQEYLGIYPYVDMATSKNSDELYLWVNESEDVYVKFDKWIEGTKPFKQN